MLGKTSANTQLTLVEYARAFADWVPANRPGSTGTFVPNPDDPDDAHVLVTIGGDDTEFVAYVDNFYRRYRQGEASPAELFAQHHEAIAQHVPSEDAEEVLLPMLKHGDWVQNLRAITPEDQMPITVRFTHDMMLTYVADTGGTARFLAPHELTERGITLDELDAQARENLVARLSEVQVSGGDNFFILQGEGTYDATMALLLGRILPQLPLPGRTAIAVPARDVILFADADVAPAMARIREMAAEISATESYALSSEIWEWNGDGLVPFA